MANVACLTPAICKTTWHRPYSAAARACSLHAGSRLATSAGARQPAGPSGREVLAAVAAEVRADLVDQDVVDGWSPRAKVEHPTGGYVSRQVRTIEPGPGKDRFAAAVRVSYLDAGGRAHRADGPAVVEYAEDGARALESWFLRDKPHRGDGPSMARYGEAYAYHWNGATLHEDDGRELSWVEVRLQNLVAAGADRADVVGWLACARLGNYRIGNGGRSRTDELIEAGVDPGTVIECWEAGLHDLDAIAQVHGGAPLSWAAAGL